MSSRLHDMPLSTYLPRMSEPFDRSPYTTAPVITVSTGITLASALCDACPAGASPGIQKAATHLSSVAAKAKGDLVNRNNQLGAFPDEDSRGLDTEADRCWGAFRLRGQAMAMLRPDVYPKAQRAVELDARLFPQGTEFLKSEYASQSTSMATILQVIDEGGLEQNITDILGPEFLAAVREVQPRYAAMVKERLRRDKAAGQNLFETIRAIQAAIVNYAGKVIGAIEHDDPATEETARVALLPILNHRDAVAAQRSGKAAPATAAPVMPAPAVEASPTAAQES